MGIRKRGRQGRRLGVRDGKNEQNRRIKDNTTEAYGD